MLRPIARRFVPRTARAELRLAMRRARHLGRGRRCTVCGAGCRAFLPNARTGRPDSTCPVCGAQERHRSIWPFLLQETPLPRARLRMLHVAPEPCFERLLRRFPLLDYVTMDLQREDVMVRTDLTKLVFEAGEFDLLLCNHVLEHVRDDRAAMGEMLRVLSPGGLAIVTVPGPDPKLGFPAELGQTVEEPMATGPEERRRRFGHPQHVRQYGRDLGRRLEEAGFRVRYFEYGRQLSEAERTRRGVYAYYPIYSCLRPR